MAAGDIIADGAIGTVINVIGTGPHRLSASSRPEWFFKKAQYGGILCDIGSHQIEQFLHFSGAKDAEVVSATVGNFNTPITPSWKILAMRIWWPTMARPTITGSIGSPRTGCGPGATAAPSSSAPKAISNCANTSMWRAHKPAITCI